MPHPLLQLLLAALGLALCGAQEPSVPRALPVEPREEEIPRALPVEPATPAGTEEPPRAEPVLLGKAATLPPDDEPKRALPADPEAPAAPGDKEKPGEPKQPKVDFEPPPLPPSSKQSGSEGEDEPIIGAAWQTRTEARTLTLKIPAPRGQITDRHGRALAQNKVGYFLALKLPLLLGSSDQQVVEYARGLMRASAGRLGANWTLKDEAILTHYRNRRWLPLPFSAMLSEAQVEAVSEKLPAGVELFPTYQRYYPGGGTACHVVGYVGRKAKVPTGPVESGEPMWAITEGREGLEVTFDKHLQGAPGAVNFLFDTDGAKLSEDVLGQPVPGKNVITSIDLEMQKLAEAALAKHTDRGAFVVMDVRTGDIYAMASRPTYDINTWVPAISTEQFKSLQEDPDLPLFPRAFRGQYPPASTFKVSVALAALESGAVDATTLIDCPTSITIGQEVYRNWNKQAEGQLTVIGAIMRSCNTWFYTVGRMTGGDNVSSMAHRFGFGSKTGLPLNAEAAGFMPTDALTRERYGHPFSHGYLAHASIGQGYVLATPLQVAQMMAGIGNGYALPKPRLVLQVQDLNGNVIESFPPVEHNALNLQSHNLGYVRQGMIDVVNAGYGTAKSARNDYVTLAGKTGTGQWVQNGEKLYLSWFAGFVPAEDPKYAFAAVCEGSPGEYITGGKKSAPMVGNYFNTLYKLKKQRGQLGGYVRSATVSTHTAVASEVEVAPEATVPEGRPVDEVKPRRRGIFNFGRRNRR